MLRGVAPLSSAVVPRSPVVPSSRNIVRGATCVPTRLPEAGLQTDCKRPVRDGLSVAVTRRYGGRFETALQGCVWHRPAPGVRVLGKLITQRSQVQILSPQRDEA